VIEDVARRNKKFFYLELVKERMFDLFNQSSAEAAWKVFEEVGDWIWQQNFQPLMKWHKNLESGWDTVKNFFTHRFTTGLAEARNNIIKTLKKRAYGYRNMDISGLKSCRFAAT
jgi:transposase